MVEWTVELWSSDGCLVGAGGSRMGQPCCPSLTWHTEVKRTNGAKDLGVLMSSMLAHALCPWTCAMNDVPGRAQKTIPELSEATSLFVLHQSTKFKPAMAFDRLACGLSHKSCPRKGHNTVYVQYMICIYVYIFRLSVCSAAVFQVFLSGPCSTSNCQKSWHFLASNGPILELP